MTAGHEILNALYSAGYKFKILNPQDQQRILINVDGYMNTLRIYAWKVTDNGRATGKARPTDERRIQAARTTPIEINDNYETLILGWCDSYGDSPIIVAFNPFGVAHRVNSKINKKMSENTRDARASDSQQFRQGLIDQACAEGMALGTNQHGEHVVAFKPENLKIYLNNIKPRLQNSNLNFAPHPIDKSMQERVRQAALDDAAPLDWAEMAPPQPFDTEMLEDGRERLAREIVIRRGQSAFRNRLIETYCHCLVTGSLVIETLEAAHIIPYQGPGTNHVSNGLLLRADIHTLFDMGLLAINHENLNIIVSSALAGSEYQALHGTPLKILESKRDIPSRQALWLHRNTSGL